MPVTAHTTNISHMFTHLLTATHPSANRARRRLTTAPSRHQIRCRWKSVTWNERQLVQFITTSICDWVDRVLFAVRHVAVAWSI